MSFNNNNINYQLLVYADNVRILGESVHTVKENTASLEAARKGGGGYKQMLIKTKYMIMSRDQNAGRSHNIKTDDIVPLKGWNSSNIWKQPKRIKILLKKKLRVD